MKTTSNKSNMLQKLNHHKAVISSGARLLTISLLLLFFFLAANTANAQAKVNYVNFHDGNGKGIRFWDGNNNYKISMANTSDYKYGPVNNYSIKNNMNNHDGSGWTWGVNGQVPVAAINTQGNMKLKGTLDVGGLTINGQTVGGATENYDVIAGGGKGLRFWNGDDRFKISMANTSDYKYGPVNNYSIKNNMNNHDGSGWTWGINGQVPVAAINTQGNMKLKGTLDVGGLTINGEAATDSNGNLQVRNIKTRSIYDLGYPVEITEIGTMAIGSYGDSEAASSVAYIGNSNFSFEDRAKNYALIQRQDGRTYLNSSAGTGLHFRIDNEDVMVVKSDGDVNVRKDLIVDGNMSVTGNITTTEENITVHTNSDGTFMNKQVYDNFEDTRDKNFALRQNGDGRTYLNAKAGQSVYIDINASHAVEIDKDKTVTIKTKLGIGTDEVIQGTVLTVDGRTYISENGGTDEGFSTTFANDVNYQKYLLWVEEGIVSVDFAIAEVKYWPDYVFKADYKLKSLEDVEKNINQNGHLPTMLSGKTIEKNGFTVKDMTKRIVKTIEELTLHTIAQEKQIDALMDRLVRLEQMLENKGK